MKRYLLFLFAISSCLMVNAQNKGDNEENKIQALKIAFITQKLALTSDEAQKFWPVYNKYSSEVRNLRLNKQGDVIERDEKLLQLKKKYIGSFEKILGNDRANQLFKVEGEFRNVLIKQLKNRRGNR